MCIYDYLYNCEGVCVCVCDSVLSKRLLKPEIGENKLLKVATVAYELNLINNSLQVYWGCGFVWNCLVCTKFP